jgi:hypothetical protein
MQDSEVVIVELGVHLFALLVKEILLSTLLMET